MSSAPKKSLVDASTRKEKSILRLDFSSVTSSISSQGHILCRSSETEVISLLSNLCREETKPNPKKLVGGHVTLPEMKNLTQVFSVLEEEFYPSEKEMAHEHKMTHFLRKEPTATFDITEAGIETEAGTSEGLWEPTVLNAPLSPTYLPSRLNPESKYFYQETTGIPSPTSSTSSSSSTNH